MPSQGIRPASLFDAVTVGGSDYEIPLAEFLDEFYLAYPDKEVMQSMIDAPPPLTDDSSVDAYVAAAGEHLAIRWGLNIPPWVDEAPRMGGHRPHFVPDLATLRPILLVESPYAFRRRNIFTGEEPLQRARWPREVDVYEPAGDTSPRKFAM